MTDYCWDVILGCVDCAAGFVVHFSAGKLVESVDCVVVVVVSLASVAAMFDVNVYVAWAVVVVALERCAPNVAVILAFARSAVCVSVSVVSVGVCVASAVVSEAEVGGAAVAMVADGLVVAVGTDVAVVAVAAGPVAAFVVVAAAAAAARAVDPAFAATGFDVVSSSACCSSNLARSCHFAAGTPDSSQLADAV